MEKTRIAAADVMGAAFSAVFREKGLALLLSAFVGVLSLILLWPFIGYYAEILSAMMVGQLESMQAVSDQMAVELLSYLPIFFLLLIPVLLIQFGVYTLWSRSTILGAKAAMEEGFRALANRTLWVIWRFICGMGWAFIVVLGVWAFFFILGLLFGLGASSSGSDFGAFGVLIFLLVFPLYIAMFIGMMVLYVLIAFSIHAEARDMRMPIHKAYQLMKGNMLRAGGLYFLVLILLQMGISPIFFMALPSSADGLGIGAIIGLVIAFAIANLTTLLWLSYGAEYAKRLLPNLSIGDVFK